MDFCFELESAHRTGTQLSPVQKIAVYIRRRLAIVMRFSEKDSAVRVICKPFLDKTDEEKRAESLRVFQSTAGVIEETVAKLCPEERGITFAF